MEAEKFMLAEKKCVPCESGVPPVSPEERQQMLKELRGWEIVGDHHLSRTFKFSNFVDALDWTNKLGALAEEQGHHPDIYLTWGKVKVDVWTHKIDNLSEADFILAAKIDRIAPKN